MRIIENSTFKFKKEETRVVTTRNLVDHMINNRVMFVPKYNAREYLNTRKNTTI